MQNVGSTESFDDLERRERKLAALAPDPRVAAMHRELADHYRDMTGEVGRMRRR